MFPGLGKTDGRGVFYLIWSVLKKIKLPMSHLKKLIKPPKVILNSDNNLKFQIY